MKSKIISLYDYKLLIPESWTLTMQRSVIEGQIDAEIETLRLSSKKSVPVDEIDRGDIVTLSLRSSLPRFNRSKVTLSAGSGFFSKELEETLIGKKVNEVYSAMISKEEVEVTILSCFRTVIPDTVDDEMIKSLGKTGITTVSEYRSWLLEYFKEMCRHESAKSWAIYEYFDRVSQKSLWEIDVEEENLLFKNWLSLQPEEKREHLSENALEYEREFAKRLLKLTLTAAYYKGEEPGPLPDVSDASVVMKILEEGTAPIAELLEQRLNFEFTKE